VGNHSEVVRSPNEYDGCDGNSDNGHHTGCNPNRQSANQRRDVSGFLEIVSGQSGRPGIFQGSVNGMENVFTGLNITVDGQNASRGDINGFLDTEGGEQARITRSSWTVCRKLISPTTGIARRVVFRLDRR